METITLLPRLHLLRFEVGQAYLWAEDDALTLIDSGPVGSADAIAGAVRGLGRDPGDVRHLVLTHFHEDHTGAAAEIAGWGAVTVCAHHLEAPVIRAEVAGDPPDMDEAPPWERDLWASLPPLTPAPPTPVHREVDDGDTLPFGGGARIVHGPGHTRGSIGIHLPAHGVLFTGDTVAGTGDGGAMPGVFNQDRARTLESMRGFGRLAPEIACFGHGDPVLRGAGKAITAAVEREVRPVPED
ncbi:MBL fold metallo-hydrolase [Streptomyces sp. WMMC897]|uniref:MBL fold metallo-hydrolase n=1 Tax=Streptomyces sp. WMMC897 TaxID=3014782 RepID=UPI0022B62BB1|nr:MBL fold metallo-hydrolase [Streptomyces sp. WMMC897]MCZ7415633.1 MBL fold metallo-hydrolase [Streptomyces sp. WMMC897]